MIEFVHRMACLYKGVVDKKNKRGKDQILITRWRKKSGAEE